jgi:hypothetical protein
MKRLLPFLFLFVLTGCAVTSKYTEPHTYERIVPLSENKTILKNKIKYSIEGFEQNGYKIRVFVKEENKNIVKCERVKSKEKVKRTDTIYYDTPVLERLLALCFLGIFGMPEGTERTEKGAETVIGEEKLTETDEGVDIIHNFEPKPDIPVRFSSGHFKFDNDLNTITLNTDEKGSAVVTIKETPAFWRVTERELVNTLSKNLEDQIKDKSIRETAINSLQIKPAKYPIEAETVKTAKVINSSGNGYFSEVYNDKKTFNIAGYQAYFLEAYNAIQELIRKELEKKFLSSLSIQVRDIESHYPIDNAVISFNPQKNITIEELTAEEEKIRKKYLVEGSEIYEAAKINPSQFLIILNGQHNIPKEGTTLISNINSVYELEVMHSEYRFLIDKISFEKKENTKIIELISLGSKIRTQETPNHDGRVINVEK